MFAHVSRHGTYIAWLLNMADQKPKLTIPELAAKKKAGARLAMVAVGEVLTATWAERAGVDIVGVGDSLGMTLHGHENTLAMTVDQMIIHCQAVRRVRPTRYACCPCLMDLTPRLTWQ